MPSRKKPINESTPKTDSNKSHTEEAISNDKIYELKLDTLQSFKNQPFSPYSGKRRDAMIDSIRYNGVHNPIIVRPLNNEKWEILSGHNRVEASKEVGNETIPARILRGLSEEEALLIVTETNLFQRSITDMSHSELALALATHYEATKKQGRRSDLIEAIESMVNNVNDTDTSGTVRQKTDSRKQAGAIYGMSERNVGYYLRLNKLIDSHKERLDSGEMAKRTAVALSYLSLEEQQLVDDVLSSTKQKIFEKDAEELREISKDGALTREKIEETLTKTELASTPVFKLSNRLSKYFDSAQKPQEIEDEIMRALEYYRKRDKPIKEDDKITPGYHPMENK